MGTTERRDAERRGRRAESLALLALRMKGFRLLERRCRNHAGEIDLVVRRGRLVAAVEVKARRQGDEHPVAPRQWQRIAAALDTYVAHRPDLATLDRRFDLVVVAPGRWPRHTPDAWRP